MDLKIKGVTDDSRQVQKGFVFVAIKGLTSDGHDFIADAIERGAVKIYGEKKLNYPNYFRVSNSRQKLGELASEFYGNPSSKLKLIGVTGTKGKTTTCHLIHHVLTKLDKKTGLISSVTTQGFHTTNPGIIELNKELSEMVKKSYEFAVIEVSSHGIDQGRIEGLNFEVGVLTNIAPEHLDYHKTFKEYKRVKMSFLKSCKIQVVSNKKANINILEGEFNNINAETAVKVAFDLGLDYEKAKKTLNSFELPEGRLEEVKNKLGMKIYIDFAHTPDSLLAVLKHLRSITNGKLITVFGCAGERDPFKRPKMGKIAAKLSDLVVLTAEDPRSENVSDIINSIRSGMPKNFSNVVEITDRKKAIEFAIKGARKGDLVAILGKGHEKSMNLDGKTEMPWSDRKVIESALKIKR